MFESPESRAALAHIKAFLATHAPAGLIDERALALVGESAERVNEGLNALRREMGDGMAQCDPAFSSSLQFAVAFAFGEMVRERLREIELHGRGRA